MSIKILIVAVALIVSSYSFTMTHNTDLVPDKLTDDQNKARDYVTGQLWRLKGANLVGGQQNGDTYTFRFLGNDLPITLTDVWVTKSKSKEGADQYEITKQATSATVQGLQGGKRITTQKVFTKGGNTFADAVKVFGN